ncbi:MAG: radical SAM protein [Cyclobacteriaceae bacterium]|nr:radical SAM protein [Cyclobacteriaceae bacterium]
MRLISHPILCNYYVTYRCNASCGFCDIWEKPSPYITTENAKQNLLDLKKLGVKVIDFTGGEPLLHREIDQLLLMAKNLGFITTITTNCLLYPKWAERLKGKVDMLHFSLDSMNKDKHDEGRGVACYDFVMESVRLAKKLGEKPDILFTVFEDNIDEIHEVHGFCQKNNLVLILNPAFEYNKVTVKGNFKSTDLNKLRKWSKAKNVYLNNAFLNLREDGGNHVERPICKAASSTIVISPNNKLMLPCYHLGISNLSIDGNLYDLYNSEKVQKLVALEGQYPQCEGCTINCYMQTSFAVEMNKYWWSALPSTLKYNKMKGTWKQLF